VNTGKRAYLEATIEILNRARAFYVDFFLAHAEKLEERVSYYSVKHQEMRERALSANELLTWAEFHTVVTREHPHPWPAWNLSGNFPDLPFLYRRSLIKDAIGKVRSYLSNQANWQHTNKNKKKGKPGLPGAGSHPTLYEGAFSLELDSPDLRATFVRLKVYTGSCWIWANYPVRSSRYFELRLADKTWEQQSPKLVLRSKAAELHFPQKREVTAKKVSASKLDPDLITVAVDLNVKNLAVITVRRRGSIIETVFVTDQGLDQHRYRHLRRISKKQWLSGKPVKGEHSNQELWLHVHRMNEDAAHQTARVISTVCSKYPGCVLLFERLRKFNAREAGKSHRMNRKQANQLRGKINQRAREKAFTQGTVTVEVNAHGTSQYCSRCGARGERFSLRGGCRIKERWGKLFWCPACHYEANADFNASANVHHSFYREWHWQSFPKPPPEAKGSIRGG
jgi:transposase